MDLEMVSSFFGGVAEIGGGGKGWKKCGLSFESSEFELRWAICSGRGKEGGCGGVGGECGGVLREEERGGMMMRGSGDGRLS
jgi:hypothetical protein